jgi:hypothetical protein
MLKNFTMPKKFSYPKKAFTLTAEVNMTGERLTRKLKERIINRATELTGIVPFNWTMMHGYLFVAFFGFEEMFSALEAQARLEDSNFHSQLWPEDEGNRIVGKMMRQLEAEGFKVHLHQDDGTRVDIDWKNAPLSLRGGATKA